MLKVFFIEVKLIASTKLVLLSIEQLLFCRVPVPQGRRAGLPVWAAGSLFPRDGGLGYLWGLLGPCSPGVEGWVTCGGCWVPVPQGWRAGLRSSFPVLEDAEDLPPHPRDQPEQTNIFIHSTFRGEMKRIQTPQMKNTCSLALQ